jgi:hypothetical protein
VSDKFEVIKVDGDYEVTIRITKKVKEFVAVTNYRHEPQGASAPTTTETEITSLQFSHEDKATTIKRAIRHLEVMGESDA